MRHTYALLALLLVSCSGSPTFSPKFGARGVNPDTHLVIDFGTEPTLGTSGVIRVFDMASSKMVDSLDLSIPAGYTEPRSYGPDCDYAKVPYDYSRTSVPTNRDTRPGTPSGTAEPNSRDHQLTIIGGFTDGFHFHPVLIRGTKAVIYLHNNMLEYGRRYMVVIEDEVFQTHVEPWMFSTKKKAPEGRHWTVDCTGKGDFSTVQAALDAVPDHCPDTTWITVAPGDYEEIVYARCKDNVVIKGAGKDLTRVHYANNEVFNPHPLTVKNNEKDGAFPYRRAAFSLDHCNDIVISDMTIATDLKGQAEGLLLNGDRVSLYDIHIIGDGDALQANGTIYMEDCELDGGVDAILGRGSLFAFRSAFRNSGGPMSWVRNFKPAHGDVFLDCSFESTGDRPADYGRSRSNHGSSYPDAEFVTISCRTRNFNPAGWSDVDQPSATLLEYDTRDLDSGEPVDFSQRHPYSRRLDAVADSALIAFYSTPSAVLDGWTPRRPK